MGLIADTVLGAFGYGRVDGLRQNPLGVWRPGFEGMVPRTAPPSAQPDGPNRGALVPSPQRHETLTRFWNTADRQRRQRIWHEVDALFASDPLLHAALEKTFYPAVGNESPVRETLPKNDTSYSASQARLADRVSAPVDAMLDTAFLRRVALVLGMYATCPVQLGYHRLKGQVKTSEVVELEIMPPFGFDVRTDAQGRIYKGLPEYENGTLKNPAYIQYDTQSNLEVVKGRFRPQDIAWATINRVPWGQFGVPLVFPAIRHAVGRIDALFNLPEARQAGFPTLVIRTMEQYGEPELRNFSRNLPKARIARGERITAQEALILNGNAEASLLTPGTDMFSDLGDVHVQGELVSLCFGLAYALLVGVERLQARSLEILVEELYESQKSIAATLRDEVLMPIHSAAWLAAGIDVAEITTQFTFAQSERFAQRLQKAQLAVQMADKGYFPRQDACTVVARAIGGDPKAMWGRLQEEKKLYGDPWEEPVEPFDAPQLQAGSPQGTVLPMSKRFTSDARRTNNTTGKARGAT